MHSNRHAVVACEALESRRLLASVPSGFTDAIVASSITAPTSMALAPDGRIFVTQQGGQVRVIRDGQVLATPFASVSTEAVGERGLLGLAFDPGFSTNRHVYVYYTVPSTPRHNRITRFTASLNSNGTIGDTAVPGSETLILQLDNLSNATNHNGGALHFGPDGKLYVAVGDNATSANAQSLSTRHGKLLRINKDGSIPGDNPFFTTATGVNRAIWALGLRNPFTFAFRGTTTKMHINDVGASTAEEINDGGPGRNYGWPQTEGFFNASQFPNFTNPVFAYGRSEGIAITGGAFYSPATQQFPSGYVSDYFYADFGGGWIRRLDSVNNTSSGFATGIVQPVDLDVAPDGSLYYLERGNGGRVGRITFNQTPQVVVDMEPAAIGSVPSYVEDAFSFTSLPGTGSGTSTEALQIYGTPQGYASKVLHPSNWGRKIVVKRQDNAPFSLTSLDYAASRYGDSGDFVLTGRFAGGSTQTQTVAFNTKQYRTLAVNWQNLSSFEVNYAGGANSAYGALDNVRLGPALASAYQFVSGRAVMEAEGFDARTVTGSHAWQQVSAGVGGASVQALPDSGANIKTNITSTSPRLDYRVNFPAAGTYYLWVRGRGVAGDLSHSNSLHAGLNGQLSSVAEHVTGVGESFSWTGRTDNGQRARITVGSAGVHTVNLWMREDGLTLDRLLLTADSSYTPTGDGPPASPRG